MMEQKANGIGSSSTVDADRLPVPCRHCIRRFKSIRAMHGHLRTHPRAMKGCARDLDIVIDGGFTSKDVLEAAETLVLMKNGIKGCKQRTAASPQEGRNRPKKLKDTELDRKGSLQKRNKRRGCSPALSVVRESLSNGATGPMVIRLPPTKRMKCQNTTQGLRGHHACKICHRVFPSARALGGHQRVHSKKALPPISGKNQAPVAKDQHQESDGA
ncbi:zinc finger protein ZAT3-like [Wolffia australiana]